MPPSPVDRADPETIARIQRGFEEALPKIRTVLRFRLRHLRGEAKEEAMAEATAIAWQGYLSLCRRGRDPESLVGKIAEYASRTVRSGRRLAGDPSVRDVMSIRARHRHGHQVGSLPVGDEDPVAPEVRDALRDRRGPSPADEVIARLDFEEWLLGLSPQQRDIAQELTAGQNTVEVAGKHGVTRTRIFQHRQQMQKDWERHFHGEDQGR